MSWERVYTVEDFYDCPRSGFADFGGKPHAYNCRFDQTADDWTNEYLTKEIDSNLFAMVMEKWAIWQRWEEAFHGGKTTIDTHPALDEERARYMTLKKVIEEQLAATSAKRHLAKGNFRQKGQKTEFGLGNFEVEWIQIAE